MVSLCNCRAVEANNVDCFRGRVVKELWMSMCVKCASLFFMVLCFFVVACELVFAVTAYLGHHQSGKVYLFTCGISRKTVVFSTLMIIAG